MSLSATLGGGLSVPAWLCYLDAKVRTLPIDGVAARPGLAIQNPVQSLSGGARSSRKECFRRLKGATTYKEELLSTTAYPTRRYVLIRLLNQNENSTALPPHGGSREYVLVGPLESPGDELMMEDQGEFRHPRIKRPDLGLIRSRMCVGLSGEPLRLSCEHELATVRPSYASDRKSSLFGLLINFNLVEQS